MRKTARSAAAAIMTFETKKIIDFCVPIFCHQFYHLDNDVVATVHCAAVPCSGRVREP